MRGRLVRPALALAAVALAGVLPGCQVKDSPGDAANGKKIFVAKCGACHVLNRAGSKGNTGPNLDYAFRQSRRDGIPTDSIRGVVNRQILYPAASGRMPGKLVTGSDARDVATYVAQSVARKGEDKGLLASIGAATKKTKATAKGGKLSIPMDPSGQLAFLVGSATSKPGPLQIDSLNKSGTDHNIALKGPGVNQKGPVIKGGATSKIDVTLKPGTYTFFCSVPGHEQGGMEGKLTVK